MEVAGVAEDVRAVLPLEPAFGEFVEEGAAAVWLIEEHQAVDFLGRLAGVPHAEGAEESVHDGLNFGVVKRTEGLRVIGIDVDVPLLTAGLRAFPSEANKSAHPFRRGDGLNIVGHSVIIM